jgi:acyl-CoA thioester hydrolase
MVHAHSFPLRVYYEDTDAGGVVYHANYLKFAERARTEWLRTLGFDQSRLALEEGILIVMRRCTVEFLSPARLDDQLVVETHIKTLGKVRMTMEQAIKLGGKQISAVEVELVCVGKNARPTPWPDALMKRFEKIAAV